MRSHSLQHSLGGLAVGAVLICATTAQDGPSGDVRVVPAPHEGLTDPGRAEPLQTEGDRVTDSFGRVETMEETMLRIAASDPVPQVNKRLRNGRAGTWELAGQRLRFPAHSGRHYAYNKWGDQRMGIGFGRSVDFEGVWVGGFGGNGSTAKGLRIVGYRDGAEVARTGWLRDISRTPTFVAAGFAGVDRIELVADPAVGEAGWYSIDDLTFTDGATGARSVLDFEDLQYEDSLTGSGYAGLVWEKGTGFTTDVDLTQVPPPHRPPTGQGGPPGGPTATGQGTLPILIQQFNGTQLGDPGANAIPPDTCGSVGIDHYVTVVNSAITMYEKAPPNTQVFHQSLAGFLGFGGFPGDPRVVFDPDSQRWIVIATNFNNRIYVAVSTSSDPTGSWFKGWFNPSQDTDAGKWPDYPTLGVDQRGIYIAAHMVSPFLTLFALEKAPLVSGAPAFGAITAFRNLNNEGAIQPCVHWDDAGGAYAVSTNGLNRIRVRRVDPPLNNPTLVNVGFVDLTTTSTPPSDAPALGSNTDLDTVGNWLMNAVYRNGAVWTAHTVSVAGRAASRCYQLDPVGLTQTQVITARDNVTQELHYFFPTVAVNSQGEAAMGGTVSSENQYAGCYYTGRLTSDPLGEMAFPFEYKTGSGPYNQLDGTGRNRWGDYSLTAADPVDDTIWTVQEFSRSQNRWRINIAQVGFDDGTTTYCNPGDGNPNNVATIGVSGTDLSGPDITVDAANVPANVNGYLVVGASNAAVPNPPGAKGTLCVTGGCQGRYGTDIQSSGSGGTYSTDIKSPQTACGMMGSGDYCLPGGCGPANIQAGETWYFQYWHRQPMMAPASFSEAICVTFQ